MFIVGLALLACGPVDAASELSPAGNWQLVAHVTRGDMVISMEKNGTLKGSLLGDTLEGTYESTTRRVSIRRLHSNDEGKLLPVQEFNGIFRAPENPDATRTLVGKFRSVAGPEWGKEGVDYDWQATALPGTFLDADLRGFAGRWEVTDYQVANLMQQTIPRTCPLLKKGVVLVVEGNQIFHNGKMIATLANDLRMPGTMPPMRPHRKPMMIVFNDGTAYLVAYDNLTPNALQMVFPHTVGNVGFGQFITWARLPEKP